MSETNGRSLLIPVLVILTLAGCAHAIQPAKGFPQFADRKSSLGHVTLLCEVRVLQEMKGDVEQILLDESSALGSEVERRMRDALVAKDYPVDGSAVSTGPTPRRWTRSPSDTTVGPPADATGVFSTPFIRDTTLLRNPAIVTAWMSLLTRLSWLDDQNWPSTFYQPKPGETPALLTEAVALCDSLGGDAIAVFRLSFFAWEESQGHTLEPSRRLSLFEMLTGGRLLKSTTTLELTLIDGKRGEMLWHDRQLEFGSYDRKVIESMMTKLVANLP